MSIRTTGLALAAALLLSGCRIEVYDQLSQRDANEIAALLLSNAIDARRVEEKDGTFAVQVPEDDFAVAVRLIADSGLPRPRFHSMVDVFDTDRLISSPSEERARLGYAVSQELSRTVSEIDGVVSARVHLAMPAIDPLGRKVNKSSASVAIHHEEALATEGLVPRIKLLVSHAVDDLEYDDVLVAMFPVGGAAPARARDTRDTGEAGLLGEMIRPDAPAGYERRAAGPVRVARGAIDDPVLFNPAIAVILAGGLIVLLIAAKGLFDRPRRQGARAEPVPAVTRRRGS